MTRRPRLLDLYSGAGGAAMGYHLAGFDVVGVDIRPQPNYPFEFHQGDAIEFVAEHAHEFDALHGSPTCQTFANVTSWRGDQANYPDLLTPTRAAFQATGLTWVIENVPEAPLRHDLLLCGSMFGLRVRRHRAFETSWQAFQLTAPCHHHPGLLAFEHKGERAYADAMGCTWMTNVEGRQAIPPAYTHHIGTELLTLVDPRQEVAA
ncbi:DNA cytosine methyltransferase [Nocardiopsis dassonvillei]|uniref:DNA cytosine methyltransferase n=1 Tax=Nocardiopsis dassonvillei TaxID=2014 RepID=UPI003F545028